jgi:hypothetical protein
MMSPITLLSYNIVITYIVLFPMEFKLEKKMESVSVTHLMLLSPDALGNVALCSSDHEGPRLYAVICMAPRRLISQPPLAHICYRYLPSQRNLVTVRRNLSTIFDIRVYILPIKDILNYSKGAR